MDSVKIVTEKPYDKCLENTFLNSLVKKTVSLFENDHKRKQYVKKKLKKYKKVGKELRKALVERFSVLDKKISCGEDIENSLLERSRLFNKIRFSLHACQDARRLLELKKKEEEAYVELSIGGIFLLHFEESRICAEKTLEINPLSSMGWVNRGRANIKAPYEERMRDVKKSIELDPNNYFALLRLALLLNDQKKVEECGELLKKVRKMKESEYNPVYYMYKSTLQATQSVISRDEKEVEKISKESIFSMVKSLLLEPRIAVSYCDIGNMYSNLGNHMEAVVNYTFAIEFSPKNCVDHVFFTNRGLSYKELGNQEAAIKDYLEAIKISEGDGFYKVDKSSLYYYISDCYMMKYEFEKAITFIDKALKVGDEIDPYFHVLKGEILFNQSKIVESFHEFYLSHKIQVKQSSDVYALRDNAHRIWVKDLSRGEKSLSIRLLERDPVEDDYHLLHHVRLFTRHCLGDYTSVDEDISFLEPRKAIKERFDYVTDNFKSTKLEYYDDQARICSIKFFSLLLVGY